MSNALFTLKTMANKEKVPAIFFNAGNKISIHINTVKNNRYLHFCTFRRHFSKTAVALFSSSWSREDTFIYYLLQTCYCNLINPNEHSAHSFSITVSASQRTKHLFFSFGPTESNTFFFRKKADSPGENILVLSRGSLQRVLLKFKNVCICGTAAGINTFPGWRQKRTNLL